MNETGLKKILQGMIDKKEDLDESLVPIIQDALEAIETIEPAKLKEIVNVASDVCSTAATTMMTCGVSKEVAVGNAIANTIVMSAFYLAGMKAAVSQA